jgi:hypothetical protein
LIELLKKIYGRLLIACRRALEVGRSAMELQRVVVVLKKSRCDSRVERNAGQTGICIRSREDELCKILISQ